MGGDIAYSGCVLTALLLMQAVDAQKYAEQITTKFKQLVSIDPYRKGYYCDLCEYHSLMLALEASTIGLHYHLSVTIVCRFMYSVHLFTCTVYQWYVYQKVQGRQMCL